MNPYAAIPVHWKHTEQDITVFTYAEGPKRAVFCRGAIAFPFLNEHACFTGAVSVISQFKNEICCVHSVHEFRSYDQTLADYFRKMYDTFGIFQYYYNPDGPGSIECNRFLCDMEMRMSLQKDSLYPELNRVPAGTDNQAFVTLDNKTKMQKFLNASPVLDRAITDFDSMKSFYQAPAAVQSVCIALNGIARDAWSAFDAYRIATTAPKFDLMKELFEHDND